MGLPSLACLPLAKTLVSFLPVAVVVVSTFTFPSRLANAFWETALHRLMSADAIALLTCRRNASYSNTAALADTVWQGEKNGERLTSSVNLLPCRVCVHLTWT